MSSLRLKRLASALLVGLPLAASAAAPVIDVYKSPTCGCCEAWVKHMRANGFTVHAHNVPNPAQYRATYGMPEQLGSCHTALVGGYVLEGHVPAADVKRLLAAKPSAKGLAVPGMVAGSPGMEGEHRDAYDVLLVQGGGQSSVYRHYAQ